MLPRRHLPLALAATFVAVPLVAQAPSYLGASAPPDLVGGMTLRAGMASGSSVSVLTGLLGSLGTPGERDAWTVGLGSAPAVGFRLQYTVATQSFRVFVGAITNPTVTENAPGVQATAAAATATFGGTTWSGVEFTVGSVATGFNLLRLENPSTALVLRSLVATSNGTTTTLVTSGTTLASPQAAQFFGLTSAYDFTVTGRYDVTGTACSGANCRLDLGLATSQTMGPTVVPEPWTPLLVAAGLALLPVFLGRGRRTA